MVDHEGRRYVVAAAHVVKLGSTGWSIAIGQDSAGRMEYYSPNTFVHLGEYRKSADSFRAIDLCAAQVRSDLESWYENRTPRGLFDKRRNHVLASSSMAEPEEGQIYGFSGRVRTEEHGPGTFVAEFAVYPGLSCQRAEQEVHYFELPVPHPGHDAFHGCSGSPIVDFERRLVAIVTGGEESSNTTRGVANQRILPILQLMAADADR